MNLHGRAPRLMMLRMTMMPPMPNLLNLVRFWRHCGHRFTTALIASDVNDPTETCAVEGCCSATLCRRHFARVLQLRLAKRIEQAVVEDWVRATPGRPHLIQARGQSRRHQPGCRRGLP